jgi:hypothetical protein
MEAVVTDVIAALKAGIGAAVTAVNAGVTDNIEITAPNAASYLVGISAEELDSATLQLANPTVIVRGEDRMPKDGSHALGGEYGVDNSLVVSVLFQAATLSERVYMTWRYQKAVNAVLLADGVLPGIRWAGEGYMERTIPTGVWRDAVCLYVVDTFERV